MTTHTKTAAFHLRSVGAVKSTLCCISVRLWLATLSLLFAAGGACAASVYRLDPNRQSHPESSLGDFSFLLDAPAGRHGFLSTRDDGHFYFQDGERARFWGVNVASTSVFQSDETIDNVVEVLARAGVNLVRIHDIDDVSGVIDYSYGDSRHFSEARLRTVDYWIERCKQAGIYIYLDLLDYRSFKKEDGVPNAPALGRGAKPYAVFDPRLIALQKEYAYGLLVRHINTYTGLSYSADPAVCLLELSDENGLFIKRAKVADLAWPYHHDLELRWNGWLKDRYGSTRQLSSKWTNADGLHALQGGESLEIANVRLPSLLLDARWDRPYRSVSESPARVNDAARFAYLVQVNYFSEMKAYLRHIGVCIPITTVGSEDVIPDVRSISDALDFVGTNFYWDHPRYQGAEWRQPSYFSDANPIEAMGSHTFAPTSAFCKVRGKPLVLREWNYCWPNSYRAAGMVEATAYACLQDVDAMLLFTYDTDDRYRFLSYFDVSHDPSRWSMMGPMAAVFLRRMVAPASRVVDIAYSDDDVFHYSGYLSSMYSASWVSRVQNVFFNQSWQPDGADLVLSSGRSATASYPGTRTVIRTNNRYEGNHGPVSQATCSYRSGYVVPSDLTPAGSFSFSGELFPAQSNVVMDDGWRYKTRAVINQRLVPIGVSSDGGHCVGFYDPERQNYVFQDLDEPNALRAALDGLHRWYNVPDDHYAVHRDRFVSDTGEIVRDCATGVLEVNTPMFQAIAGRLRDAHTYRDTGLLVHSQSDGGAVVAVSLDNRPLESSHEVLVSMMTSAANTGQAARWVGENDAAVQLVKTGTAPVRTGGEPILFPTEVKLYGRPVASVYLHGGAWMMLQAGNQCTFYCDTPQVKVQIAEFYHPTIIEPSLGGAETALSPDVVSLLPGNAFLTPKPDDMVHLDHG